MTYSENLVQLILDVVNYHGTQAEMIALAEEALQAQREATLDRMNQYAIDNTGEPLPPEMQFIILHTEVQP